MLRIRHLGRVPYEEAFALQHALAEHARDDYVLLLEHPHVYTLGVRADTSHVLADPESVGAALVSTDRGGDVTYHGPGQVVMYPVLTVHDEPSAGRQHVQRVEQVAIEALRSCGVEPVVGGVGRLEGYPGVWAGVYGSRPRKIAAVGVRTIRTGGRRRTLHGLALNVECDLSMFEHIVPCGIRELPVTSLRAEGVTLTMAEMIEALIGSAVAMWSPRQGVERQGVAAPSGSTAMTVGASSRAGTRESPPAEQPLLRRLRSVGVDPGMAVPLRSPKPSWLRARARMGDAYLGLRRTLRGAGLVTVCQEAGCPNIYECWAEGTATFMVSGSRCTRACGFCLVDTRHPLPIDPTEPERVAEAVAKMGLAHAVVTCVARDDLEDGGAGAIAATVAAIRRRRPGTRVEVLISDCKGDERALQWIFDAHPDVLNHNVETVARLQRAVRPSAGYARSLTVLARSVRAGLATKSGLMVGLGETRQEIISTMADLASVGVTIVTVGQYLRPTVKHLPVARWWRPEEFGELRAAGLALGLAHVEASPLVRSSYRAGSAARVAAGQSFSAGTAGQRARAK